jgi:hypothetical protein
MRNIPARIALILAAAAAMSMPAAAQKFDPGSVYICPNHPETGLDCYLDAVVHLYTMCRHVKSIEIIEFGHAQSQEGVNGAKSEYCIDKQKINITRPYQAALREATGWREAVDDLRQLQAYWLDSMAKLKWRTGEAPDDYEDRVNKIYDELSWKIDAVRVSFTTPPDNAGGTRMAAPKPAAKSAKAKAAATAKAN